MIRFLSGFGVAIVLLAGGFLYFNHVWSTSLLTTVPATAATRDSGTPALPAPAPTPRATSDIVTPVPIAEKKTTTSTATTGEHVYTQSELLAMAGNTYADGNIPLGDYHYVTDAPKVGYIYLCNVHKDNPGSMVNGPWIHGETWNFLQKISVDGAVSWPNATFSDTVSGLQRILTGNDLPINHTTGTFPVQSGTTAAQYDPNPNTISAQTMRESLPLSPAYSNTPYCMGGEVGIMLSGVRLFDGFDAGLRDAQAHELQDSCDGHPQGSGEYHYHGMSACWKDIGETTVLGFAYDGFPITGPLVASGKYLTTADLDVCHGLTSEIMLDGKPTVTYHYVMTQDFPYSASCFRGKSTFTPGGAPRSSQQPGQTNQASQSSGPPAAALSACTNHSVDSSCAFTDDHGTHSGVCRMPPGSSSLACVPN